MYYSEIVFATEKKTLQKNPVIYSSLKTIFFYEGLLREQIEKNVFYSAIL